MPKADIPHWNPPETDQYIRLKGRARCGLRLRDGHWTEDPDDVGCNNCLRLMKLDAARAA